MNLVETGGLLSKFRGAEGNFQRMSLPIDCLALVRRLVRSETFGASVKGLCSVDLLRFKEVCGFGQ
jgi:hypothetical protein